MTVVIYKKKIVEETVEQIIHFIRNIKELYPEMKVRLNKEQIEIICNIFYDEFSKKNQIYNLYDCMDFFFSNGLYDSINQEINFDFECLKLNKLILQKYFNYLEIEFILLKIEKQLKQEIKCKVIEFKRGNYGKIKF